MFNSVMKTLAPCNVSPTSLTTLPVITNPWASALPGSALLAVRAIAVAIARDVLLHPRGRSTTLIGPPCPGMVPTNRPVPPPNDVGVPDRTARHRADKSLSTSSVVRHVLRRHARLVRSCPYMVF